jgi:hypothetical protein
MDEMKKLSNDGISLPPQRANYFGSLFQSSTVSLGMAPEGEVHVPFRDLLPMVHPDDIIFDGMPDPTPSTLCPPPSRERDRRRERERRRRGERPSDGGGDRDKETEVERERQG